MSPERYGRVEKTIQHITLNNMYSVQMDNLFCYDKIDGVNCSDLMRCDVM